jgi:hypothetical protein
MLCPATTQVAELHGDNEDPQGWPAVGSWGGKRQPMVAKSQEKQTLEHADWWNCALISQLTGLPALVHRACHSSYRHRSEALQFEGWISTQSRPRAALPASQPALAAVEVGRTAADEPDQSIAELCCAVLYCAVLCCAVLCCAVLPCQSLALSAAA